MNCGISQSVGVWDEAEPECLYLSRLLRLQGL